MRPSFGPNLPQTVTHICQKAIFKHALEENGAITNKEVQNLLNVKDSCALKILREMVVAGILKKEGKLRGSHYKMK